MLAEALMEVFPKCGETTHAIFFVVNAQTCVFEGLNWTKFSRPHSETLSKEDTISDTSMFRLSVTSPRENVGSAGIKGTRAVIRITMNTTDL